jgi:hypothetical protein
MQQCAIYILYFTAKLLYMFRMPFTLTVVECGCGLTMDTLHQITSCTFQPIVTYNLYHWSTTTVSCTSDDWCKRHPKHVE